MVYSLSYIFTFPKYVVSSVFVLPNLDPAQAMKRSDYSEEAGLLNDNRICFVNTSLP